MKGFGVPSPSLFPIISQAESPEGGSNQDGHHGRKGRERYGRYESTIVG